MIRSAYAKTLEVEEAGREEVVLHTYDFHPDAADPPKKVSVPTV